MRGGFVPYLTDAGYPIWRSEAPHIVYSLVESVSLKGKDGCSVLYICQQRIGKQCKTFEGTSEDKLEDKL